MVLPMDSRNIMVGAIVVIILIIAGAGTYMYTQQDSAAATVTLIVEYNGLKEAETFEDVGMPENSTVLDLLMEKTDVVTEDSDYGKMVISINDIAQDAGENLWWTYTMNGEYASAGAEAQLLSDGDVVKWTLSQF
ncbi:DUF4430 domain-containing protein [archaeon]|nr:MAG: DUF4430 domain-containing protein [archaeon]